MVPAFEALQLEFNEDEEELSDYFEREYIGDGAGAIPNYPSTYGIYIIVEKMGAVQNNGI